MVARILNYKILIVFIQGYYITYMYIYIYNSPFISHFVLSPFILLYTYIRTYNSFFYHSRNNSHLAHIIAVIITLIKMNFRLLYTHHFPPPPHTFSLLLLLPLNALASYLLLISD